MKPIFHFSLLSFFLIIIIVSCSPDKKFSLVKSDLIKFENTLDYTEDFNPYIYRNFYNGAGVALGDINNDGLLDVYLTGNMVDNKLFLNKGGFVFEDITKFSGVQCSDVWSTGATFADVNGDGYLDLYVCKSGPPGGENRYNELFINNGDLTFTEKAKEYGLDIIGLSVHSAFFDYDQDGDLDCYVLNNSFRTVGGYDLIEGQRKIPDPDGQGNKFLENIGDRFIDVTDKAGIYSSSIGFGLGITLSDYNSDGWTDIFVSNDFFEKDYLYINNKDKTFSEASDKFFQSLSLGSMGADSADLDNDLLTDLFVTEMLPKSLKRKKTKAVYDSWDKHSLAVSKGYHYQYPRNVLQRNYGNAGFLEIGRYSNLAATEWSWASMVFDMDNDGFKDIFIANGIYKDLLDRDYLAYMANKERVSNILKSEKEGIKKLIDIMPSSPVKNYVFKNNGDFNFTEVNSKWGFDQPSFSNGMSYGDLDNDGDLDIVINNVNMPSFIYKNNNDNKKYKSISFELKGEEKNRNAIGAKIILKYDNITSIVENFPSRGFQSSVPNKLHFGVGNKDKIDSIIILWGKNKLSYLTNLKTNKTHTISIDSAINGNYKYIKEKNLPFKSLDAPLFDFKHKENRFLDFNKERLLTQMVSNEGPSLASSDLNNDGIVDFFVGGAKNQKSKIFISNNKVYEEIDSPFDDNIVSEDIDAVFFDSDNDGDFDLLVASGDKSSSIYDNSLNDRLYINYGKNKFKLSKNSFVFNNRFATGAVAVADYNNDNLLDVFIGERFNNNYYGFPVSGHIFQNMGGNNFKEIRQPELENIGMIKTAKWTDLNNDDYPDLIVAGDWTPIKVFINKNGVLKDKTLEYGLSKSNGMWNDIEIEDINCDGFLDILAGNIGENTFFKPQMRLYINDFDDNGSLEQIICYKIGDRYFPIFDKDEMVKQIPSIKKRMFYYNEYADLSISEIFDKNKLEKSIILNLDILESSVFLNKADKFVQYPFPSEINYSSVSDIEVVKKEKKVTQLVFGGNQFGVKPQFGRYDASKGWILNIEMENDSIIYSNLTPLNIEGQIRKFEKFQRNNKNHIAVGINNEKVEFIEIK